MTVLERMNEELYELERRGIKKVKGKRVDELGRRMFDATGSYIPPNNRPSVGLVDEIKSLDHRPKLQQHKEHMRKKNQLRYIERMENQFDKEC